MTPNETAAAVARMCDQSACLRRDMQAAWQETAATIVAAERHRWPPLHPTWTRQRLDTARLAFLTAIYEGRRTEAARDALAAVGLTLETDA